MNAYFHQYWQQELMYRLMMGSEAKKKVYICSPLRAETKEGVMQNMYAAQAYMFYAIRYMQLDAEAPHAFLPLFFDDNIAEQREQALAIGRRRIEVSDHVFVCGDLITEGMRGEIFHALAFRKIIVTFREDMFCNVLELARISGESTKAVHFDRINYFMGIPITSKFIEESEYYCHDNHDRISEPKTGSET